MWKWVPLVLCNVLLVGIACMYFMAVFVDVDVNPCILTYMYPNYYRIQGENFSRFENKYELYLYKEGPGVQRKVL